MCDIGDDLNGLLEISEYAGMNSCLIDRTIAPVLCDFVMMRESFCSSLMHANGCKFVSI